MEILPGTAENKCDVKINKNKINITFFKLFDKN
jgi:hypothetical protein